MTMAYHVSIGKNLSKSAQKKVNAVILETFKQTDLIYNNWNPSSEISRINQSKNDEPLAISAKLSELLFHCDKCHKITNKRFDPTIGSIFNTWKRALVKKKHPTELHLEAVGWANINLKKLSLQKKHPKCQFDLCGISKGYTIDLLAKKLTDLGYSSFLIEWGGEVLAKGRHPKERAWSVLIQGLPKKYNNMIQLENKAIATSGTFMLDEWLLDGRSYFHIFDSKLKKPLERTAISMVTVIALDCYLADALATAAMTFSDFNDLKKWTKEVIKIYPDISFIIVNSNNHKIERIADERGNFF